MTNLRRNMCVSADNLLVQVKSVMNTRTNEKDRPWGRSFPLTGEEQDSNPSKCGESGIEPNQYIRQRRICKSGSVNRTIKTGKFLQELTHFC